MRLREAFGKIRSHFRRRPSLRSKSHHQRFVLTKEDRRFWELYEQCKDYTMTSVERMYALYDAVKYVTTNHIPGDIVECGVWKGGSSMLAALALRQFGDVSRKLFLYDTYEGMTEPTDIDIDFSNKPAKDLLEAEAAGHQAYEVRCYASLDEVTSNLSATQYPRENISFVVGKVENTIPRIVPNAISILRLDTDWYESTHHELVHLYPRLSVNGILILDDYGHWQGAKAATDRFFRENRIEINLEEIDYTGRIGIKARS